MSSRRQRATELSGGEHDTQMQDYAFTVRGHSIMDGLKGRALYEVISAYEITTFSYKVELKKAKEKNENIDTLFKADSAYTPREAAEPEAGVQQFLVVGYALRNDPERLLKDSSAKAKPVGNKLPADEAARFQWQEDLPPPLVVMPLLDNDPDNQKEKSPSVKLYVLIKPRNGLCVPHTIANDLVFYRHEFRDGSNDIKGRTRHWNERVLQHATRSGLSSSTMTSKQLKFKRAKEPSKLVFNPNISLANELSCLAASFKLTKDGWYLKEMKSILRVVDEDLGHRPPPENQGLRAFVEQDQYLSKEEAKLVVDDIVAVWPTIDNVNETKIRRLQKELIDKEITIEYRLLKPFIKHACTIIDRDGYKDAAHKAYEAVLDVLGENEKQEPVLKLTDAEQTVLLKTLLVKLKEASLAGDEIVGGMKDAFGEVTFKCDIHDVWAHFADASDTDTARAAFNQVFRILAGGFHQKEVSIKEMVDGIIAVLSKLGLEESG